MAISPSIGSAIAPYLSHPYATKNLGSCLREKELDPDPLRTEFQRDVHRITYSWNFRRLKHKTQVFFTPMNDHICTRMEHSIHVANASRTIARALGLNEDLCEAIGLGHDLGHAPFGHHGETVLSTLSSELGVSEVFHHEVNSLRVIDRLGQFDRAKQPGLNLTFEVRDGIVSHCGEDFSQKEIHPYVGTKDLNTIVKRLDAKNASTLEGCVVRLVDKVAYAGRDLEDGIRAGLITNSDIPSYLVGVLGNKNGKIVDTLIKDIIHTSPFHKNYIAMSATMFDALRQLIQFNYDHIYRHKEVEKYKYQAEQAMNNLVYALLQSLNDTDRFRNRKKTKQLPQSNGHYNIYSVLSDFVRDMRYKDDESNGQIVIDFVSGFTDNYVSAALAEIWVPKAIV